MLIIPENLLAEVEANGERAFPEEGAGFLLGELHTHREVRHVMPLPNQRESGTRCKRYLISAKEFLNAELGAEAKGLQLLGVFHSHPDHPGRPSEFDREWAQPTLSYLITAVMDGKATNSRSWILLADRTAFVEEGIQIKV
jgi:proteasome lid subunit RPN8/RPN11